MASKELLCDGNLREAYQALREEVGARPSDAHLRFVLFQVLTALGQWDRALNQLRLYAQMNPGAGLTALVQEALLQCERVRMRVFAGQMDPVLFGEPEPWMAQAVLAVRRWGAGAFEEARALLDGVASAKPDVGGAVNGMAFDAIEDSDSRLAPFLEVFIEGKYLWVPWAQIREVRLQEPGGLLDHIWIPAAFTWVNEGEMPGFIPVRYPGISEDSHPDMALARMTDWVERAPGAFEGAGQRILLAGHQETALLDIRHLTLGVRRDPS